MVYGKYGIDRRKSPPDDRGDLQVPATWPYQSVVFGPDAGTEATELVAPYLSDELSKLKTLLDNGVRSTEEFAAAKARLLR
jgi:hypothetical protein